MHTHQSAFGHSLLQFPDATRSGLRWAVGSPLGPRSNTWRLWGNKKGDIYVAVRSLGGIIKASIHRDRRCHVGFTTEYADTARIRFGSESRHQKRWRLPDGPWVRAAQIVIPASDLAAFTAPDSPQTTWLPSPPTDQASVVTIYIADPNASEAFPAPLEGVQPLAQFQFPTTIALVVHTISPLDPGTKRKIEDARIAAHSLPGAAEAPKVSSTRVVFWGSSTGAANDFYFFESSWK